MDYSAEGKRASVHLGRPPPAETAMRSGCGMLETLMHLMRHSGQDLSHHVRSIMV